MLLPASAFSLLASLAAVFTVGVLAAAWLPALSSSVHADAALIVTHLAAAIVLLFSLGWTDRMSDDY